MTSYVQMTKQITDLELVNKVKSGDVRSFETLVNRHKDFAYKIAFGVLRTHEDAEEVAHDAFVKVYSIANKFKGDAKFTTWFYRIILNMAIGRTRKKRVSTQDIDDPALRLNSAIEVQNDDEMHRFEQKKYLSQAMTELKEEERALLGLYYFKELSLDEMSGITGLTSNSMKVKIFRARKKLAKELEKVLPNEVSSIY